MTVTEAVPQELLGEVLSTIEREELKLLTWGVVDGGFTRDELSDLISEFLMRGSSGLDADEVLISLEEQNLVLQALPTQPQLYRSRMAEAIRLFARLRQLFPIHARDGTWRLAPTLVADYRLMLRPRRYPARTLTPQQVYERVRRRTPLQGVRLTVLRTLLEQRGGAALQLAKFQVDAITAILEGSGPRSRGIIIGAGTGSGKTLAFYLPALTRIADLIESEAFWTKAMALYPRNELLKDQFAEVYKEARLLDTKLQELGKRPIIIGAYFGSTPKDANSVYWEKDTHGYICPFLSCPRCGRPLVWRFADLQTSREQLSCLHGPCGTVVGPDQVVLTRKRMQSCPPDVLFTTTEMLNRRMSDSWSAPIFGVGAPRPPELVLLDEVHTYEGTAGAQAALLLRRWRRACGHKPYFVGLSATLKEAQVFFAQLTGLYRSDVEEATPKEDELISEGMEYLLALRGDPVSGASLLSTTIQAAMLTRRMLEPNSGGVARGSYGKRAFVFTDDLDVTNRLYHNLLDAEGLSAQGRRLSHRDPLASLRSSSLDGAEERRADGQVWDLCEQLGHRLDAGARLLVTRTSSQDVGVEARSDLIVATAALEVGFNDPEVGAVLQHKAPRNAAAFVQRQGRAGRQRRMRPWTVVILSDYGRDRVTYQAYDQLFSPELPVRSLPINNRYVLRMQAVYALMEWVDAYLAGRSLPRGSVWDDFTRPSHSERGQARQQEERTVLQHLLEQPRLQQNLAEHLQRALGIDDDVVRALMWDPPRALLTAVIPTLLRRMKHQWRTASGDPDLQGQNAPLPDFVPSNLFSDLNLPEVRLILQPQRPGAEPLEESLGLRQALSAFAPGRVSRRFGVHQSNLSHWMPLPELHAGHQVLPIDQYCSEYEELGRFTYVWDGVTHEVPCIRPWTIRLSNRPQEVRDTSNGMLDWRTQLVPTANATPVDIPEGLAWKDLIVSAEFYVHTLHSSVEVRRFALGSHASVALESGEALDAYVEFVQPQGGGPAAVGFNLDVDAFMVRLHMPEQLGIDSPEDAATGKGRAFRTAYFKEVILQDATLSSIANHFRLERLADTYLSALLTHALRTQTNLEDAYRALQEQGAGLAMRRVLDMVFQAAPPVEADESLADSTDTDGLGRLHRDLIDLCQTPAVIAALEGHAEVLWAAPNAGWRAWAEARFQATVGGAILEACQRLCPDIAADDLLLDIRPGALSNEAELWVTEPTIGGGGVVEEVLRRYVEDPRRFWRLVEHALQPSDLEMVDLELTRTLQLVVGEDDVRDAFASFRAANRHSETLRATHHLRLVLNARGMTASHAIMTALNARILRPGSTPAADQALHDLVTHWHHEEERLGVEIDGRVFAYYACEEPTLQRAITALAPDALSNAQTRRFPALTGLFWPRGHAVRAQTLATHNPYAKQPPADRELVLHVLEAAQPMVTLESATWQADALAHLIRFGTVRIGAASQHRRELQRQLAQLLTHPIDVGYLQLHARVVALHRTSDQLVASLDIKDAVQ